MTIIECLEQTSYWMDFYNYKYAGGHLSLNDLGDLLHYIESESYLPIIQKIKNGQGLPSPKMTTLNKKNTNKKRIVFSFAHDENYVLKCLSYHLLKYDNIFTPNLYSFRKNTGVKKAISDLTGHKAISQMYSYKVDIHDYFNSVDVRLLLSQLKELWDVEPELYAFVTSLLLNPYVEKNGELIIIPKGIMAGLPIAPFFANLYLKELDSYFWNNNIPYARYSDDIIVFAKTKDELDAHISTILHTLSDRNLTINPAKVVITEPGEKWDFLGFSYQNGIIDVSEIALQKLKGKLKRKARALYRWKLNNQKCDEYAVRAYIKYFNRKFYDNPIHNEITWCRWYFPIINTDRTLHIIDLYMQDCIRYLTTGKYSKSNYNLRYHTIKELGYRSLVNEYYKQMDKKCSP